VGCPRWVGLGPARFVRTVLGREVPGPVKAGCSPGAEEVSLLVAAARLDAAGRVPALEGTAHRPLAEVVEVPAMAAAVRPWEAAVGVA
jgi:hypothetical protein